MGKESCWEGTYISPVPYTRPGPVVRGRTRLKHRSQYPAQLSIRPSEKDHAELAYLERRSLSEAARPPPLTESDSGASYGSLPPRPAQTGAVTEIDHIVGSARQASRQPERCLSAPMAAASPGWPPLPACGRLW